MSKYQALWQYIKETNKEDLTLSFLEINNILGFNLDHSFLTFKKELLDYGYQVKHISLKEKQVLITKLKK